MLGGIFTEKPGVFDADSWQPIAAPVFVFG